ncbi:hypothetical protein R3P38DRAFT_3561850 [Favolaschia claudopus]|uniref:C2H2-type domain-containing protein n=1 Tax=Favolaschia claudopus TaxID=2862362 RepID=A0AAW0ATD7_9AGAR
MQSPRIAFHYLPASQPMSTGRSDIPDLDDTIFENMFAMRLPATHATRSAGFPVEYGTHNPDDMSDPFIDDVPATASERCALPDDDFSMSIDELYGSMCSASDFACFDPVKQAEDDARIAALDAADAAKAALDIAMEDAVYDSDSDSDEDSDDDLASGYQSDAPAVHTATFDFDHEFPNGNHSNTPEVQISTFATSSPLSSPLSAPPSTPKRPLQRLPLASIPTPNTAPPTLPRTLDALKKATLPRPAGPDADIVPANYWYLLHLGCRLSSNRTQLLCHVPACDHAAFWPDMGRHVMGHNRAVREFQCEGCPLSFSRDHALERHKVRARSKHSSAERKEALREFWETEDVRRELEECDYRVKGAVNAMDKRLVPQFAAFLKERAASKA